MSVALTVGVRSRRVGPTKLPFWANAGTNELKMQRVRKANRLNRGRRSSATRVGLIIFVLQRSGMSCGHLLARRRWVGKNAAVKFEPRIQSRPRINADQILGAGIFFRFDRSEREWP